MPAKDYRINPMLRQNSRNTCWLACFRMLLTFQQGFGRRLTPEAQWLLTVDSLQNMEQRDQALVVGKFVAIARRFGLHSTLVAGLTQPLPNGFEDATAAHEFLCRHGPFCYPVIVGGGGHLLLVCGADDQPPFGVRLVDPAYGRLLRLDGEQFKEIPPSGDPVIYY